VAVVVRGDVRVPDHPGEELAGFLRPARCRAVQRVADTVELSLVIFGLLSEDALDDRGRLGAAEAAERLDDALLVPVAPGGIGQDDAAGVIGEQRSVGEGDVPAEAAAEDDRPAQPERVAQPAQVISPGPHVPELGAAVIAAAVAPQVEVQDLEVSLQRPQGGLYRHVVQAGATMDGYDHRALYRRVSLRDDRRPGYVEPQGHIAKADAHATSSPDRFAARLRAEARR
jgi:hypothetical protein